MNLAGNSLKFTKSGKVEIGVAQEKMRAFKAQKRSVPQGGVTSDFSRQSVAVNHYYFYVQDPDAVPPPHHAPHAAAAIETAVDEVLGMGHSTRDLGGTCSTHKMGELLISAAG